MPGRVYRGAGSVRFRAATALRRLRATFRAPLRGTRTGLASRILWARNLPSRRKLGAMAAVSQFMQGNRFRRRVSRR